MQFEQMPYLIVCAVKKVFTKRQTRDEDCEI